MGFTAYAPRILPIQTKTPVMLPNDDDNESLLSSSTTLCAMSSLWPEIAKLDHLPVEVLKKISDELDDVSAICLTQVSRNLRDRITIKTGKKDSPFLLHHYSLNFKYISSCMFGCWAALIIFRL